MSYTSILTALGPVAFFSQYPISSVSGRGLAEIKKRNIGLGKAPDLPGRSHSPDGREYDLGSVRSDTRISYFELEREKQLNLASDVIAGNNWECLTFKLSVTAGAGKLPVFYLPFQENQNHKLTLVNKQGIASADLFVTDMVDGCSMYVDGPVDAPTVYHLNAAKVFPTGMHDRPVKNDTAGINSMWEEKWGHMDTRNDVLRLTHPPKQVHNAMFVDPNIRVVQRNLRAEHYMLLTGADEKLFENSLHLLQTAGKVPLWWGKGMVSRIECIHHRCLVFGVLTGRNWAFFVQKQTLVELFGSAPFTAPGSTRTRYRVESLGMQWVIRCVEEFWPGNTTGRNG